MFKALYSPDSSRQQGTMASYRMCIGRTNVSGLVKGKFESHHDFVITITEALLLKYCMNHLGMKELGDHAKNVELPDNIKNVHCAKKKEFMNKITSGIINSLFQPCNQKADHLKPNVQVFNVTPAEGKQINMQIPTALLVDHAFIDVKVSENLTVRIPGIKSDHVQDRPKGDDLFNYTHRLLQWGLHVIEIHDAIKEGDIQRTNINMKRLIPFFYNHSARSKYAVECMDYILKTELLLPEDLAVRVRLGSFVNTKGGLGNNKPADMQQENNICMLKDVIKGLGACKSEKAITRSSLAAPVVDKIVAKAQVELDLHRAKGKHTDKSNSVDVLNLLEYLQEVRPLTYQEGRRLHSYSGISKAVFANIDEDRDKFYTYLRKVSDRLKRGVHYEEADD